MPKKTEYTDEFSEFWRLWPGRWSPERETPKKVGKYEAFVEWRRIPKAEQQKILELLKSGKVKRAGTQFLPDAHRWLKKKRWHDF